VDEHIHARALSALLAAGRISFVDWVSFEVMRRLGVETAFSFDRDFAAQGFELAP
jgi:predicted nucleic acid-binding protein